MDSVTGVVSTTPLHIRHIYNGLKIIQEYSVSLLRRVADQHGKTVVGLYGSLRNIAHRLLDCLRYRLIPAEAFDPDSRIHIRLNSC